MEYAWRNKKTLQRVLQDPDFQKMNTPDLRAFVYLSDRYLVERMAGKDSVSTVICMTLFLLAWPLCIVLAFVGVWPFVAGVLFLLWTYTFRFVVDIHARLGLVTTLLARDIDYLSMHVKQIQDAFPEKKWLDAKGGVMHVYTAVRNGDSLL